MADFHNQDTKNGFSMKVWRGERMCLLGFDVAQPEADLVGFSIECKSPGSGQFFPLRNRISFSYTQPPEIAVDGTKKYYSTESPFQKFRWVHFPYEPKKAGAYRYRATKMHMPTDKKPIKGTAIELDISLAPITYDGFLDVGFTRNFASSQAYRERYTDKGLPIPIPALADEGLEFHKLTGTDVYDWLGFEAYDLLFGFLDEAIADQSITVDVLAYDLNEPDILAKLEQLKGRLRVIIDDSSTKKNGKLHGHGAAGSPESKSAARLKTSAGASRVKRTHFQNLQHHKVFIARRNGQPLKVLAGSTNFTYRGLYIQANNLLVFHDRGVAALFGQMFDLVFQSPAAFKNDPIAAKWHLVKPDGKPAVHLCFSPHKSFNLSLNPVRGAVDLADSSVFYSMAFLNLVKSGPTKEAFDRLITRPVFSYGVLDKSGQLEVRKPDGSKGVVDFAYLAKNAPEPFKSEWQGGKGINIHHKFVVTDFSLPSAKVFTGSSNLAPAGESNNGDHLIMIEDQKVATSYAIEALRMFDHLHFRTNMRDSEKKNKAKKKPEPITLKKPTAISGKPAWFEQYYLPGTQRERDRKLFSS